MRNHKPTEEIPEHVEWSGDNRSNIMVRSHGSSHHPVKCEVHHSEVHEEQVPHELQESPLESCHGVENAAVNCRLAKNIWELDNDLDQEGKDRSNSLSSPFSSVHR